jgi:hypothetical protein
MNEARVFHFLLAVFLIGGYGLAASADSRCAGCPALKSDLDKLVGGPVDIAPWCYEWRADRTVQEKPEACFIPHRLERLDKVYRTAYSALPQDQLKSLYYDMPDLLQPLLPQPAGQLQAGLLWTGGASNYQVELVWPEDMRQIPPPDAIEVRAYPTSFGWFGWTVDKILNGPEISPDRRSWTYKSDPTAKMDTSYSGKVDAATEMVAVFYDKSKAPGCGDLAIPSIHVTGPSIGVWRRIAVEIEWGFNDGVKVSDFDGRLEPSIASLGVVASLAEKNGVKVKDGAAWKSRPTKNAARKGISVPVLYAPDSRPGLDSRVTIWTKKGGFTFRVADLDKGPIYVPDRGFYVTRAGGQTAREFASEFKAKNVKSFREMTREHREATSWDELMREVRLWTCPDGTAVAPYPQVPDPVMQIELPDPKWTEVWRAASNQLTGQHLWGGLGFEVGRVAHEMEMIGLIDPADKVYDHFLKSPGVKSDGDFSDGDGSLEWATSMRHDMGYSHDGTHASTGRLLFAMSERYFLTGDKEWFQRNRARLQAAADWIIRQRTNYMKDVPNRKDLQVAGLMPPCMLGDYALPTSDWHWYYFDNVFALQGLQRFADALADFDLKTARKYGKEAKSFREDIRRAVDRDAALAPVRLGRDGAYHAYIPRMSYARGLTGPELGAPQFPECDKFIGALSLAEPFAVLDAKDPRMIDTMDMMEEMGTTPALVKEKEDARKAKGLPTDDAWFWTPYVILPKASHNANVYLLQDDVPSFLRFWMNAYASIVGADGKLWEHWHLGNFDPCATPDNGTAGWFMENFRDMLVMEDGQSLWVAKATPRAWLEQGKKISVKNAPTYFGNFAYEIVSDVDNGKISAVVNVPDRTRPKTVLLRLRHPKAAPIKSIKVNGKTWADFDSKTETINLRGARGIVTVTANY